MDVESDEERDAESEARGDAHAVVLEHLFAACKRVVRELTADYVAEELSKIWANRGRPVTAPILRSALSDSRGNYFRFEWVLWFAEHSADVRELLIGVGAGDSDKDPADELEDLKGVLRNEFPKQADRLIQRGKAPRARGGRKR
jgi:hypothetical protein